MPDNLARFERMAQRARERRSLLLARERAERMGSAASRPGFAPDRIDGEGEQSLDVDDPHFGHRTHINFLAHGNAVRCSCGALMGHFSFIPPTDEEYEQMCAAQPDGCPICRARGLDDHT